MASTSEVDRARREIETLHRKQADESKRQASASDKIARARSSISRASSASSVKSKLSEIQRLERDIANSHQKYADLAKKIAKATEQLHKAQTRLDATRVREQTRALEDLARRQESRRLIHTGDVVSLGSQVPSTATQQYDAFISHASEDKRELARPLAELLTDRGLKVWYDEMTLTIGDSLRRSIDRGLRNSRFGIVILSPSFFEKNWPQYELDGLVAREASGDNKVILPLWHKVSKDEVLNYSPPLADKLALSTATHTIKQLADELEQVLRRNEAL